MDEKDIEHENFKKKLIYLLTHDSEVRLQIKNIISEKIEFGEDTFD